MKINIEIKEKDGTTHRYSAQEKYQKENIRRIVIKLNQKTDIDILDWLDKQSNMQGAIKEAIRKQL